MLPSGCFLVTEMKEIQVLPKMFCFHIFLISVRPFLQTTRQMAADHRLKTAGVHRANNFERYAKDLNEGRLIYRQAYNYYVCKYYPDLNKVHDTQ